MAGIHWMSDFTEAVVLGETVAIRWLRQQQATAPEVGSLSLTRFDGSLVRI